MTLPMQEKGWTMIIKQRMFNCSDCGLNLHVKLIDTLNQTIKCIECGYEEGFKDHFVGIDSQTAINKFIEILEKGGNNYSTRWKTTAIKYKRRVDRLNQMVRKYARI